MMRKSRTIPVILTTIVMTALMAVTSFAAATYSDVWSQDASGIWHAYRQAGTEKQMIKGAWLCDDAVPENRQNVWYLLDQNGNMVSAGLVRDGSGNFYSMETSHNGYYGMLRYQSGDYECSGQIVHLELEDAHNGSFGAIRNNDAIEKLKSIYGLMDASQIDGRDILYTSSWMKPAASVELEGAFETMGGVYVSSEKRQAVIEAVNCFKAQYITNQMTDFEKEMTIIQWMVENINYDYANYLQGTVPTDSFSAYGAIVKRTAVCDGYTYAFMVLCKACGVDAIMVHGSEHSWNMVCLDGDWYHVDVTWEDPIPSNNYGFRKLRNKYINLTDDEVRALPDHSVWDGAGNRVANSTRYGHFAVVEWLGR